MFFDKFLKKEGDKMRAKQLADFHFHSAYSDGSENIPAIIKEAKKRGVAAMALTDHNSGDGVPEFTAACKKAGISALEGTEIYASFASEKWSWDPNFAGPVPDVVILGKKLDWQEFKKYQDMLAGYWQEFWLPETLAKLEKAGLKVPSLDKEEMQEQIKSHKTPRVLHDVPKNPGNWSKLLEICREFEPAVSLQDIKKSPVAWANRYLYSIGMQAYVLRAPQDWTVRKAADLAKSMGGVLFAAHPGEEEENWSDQHLDFFVQQGGGGLEVYHYFHTKELIGKLSIYAGKHGLLVSGGSDWHGKNGSQTLGCWDKPDNQTPIEVFYQLQNRLP